ncbi:MAG: UDP-N-acetylglucosamine 1-carboxyvinyltransferase [Egibacteraceae bacterium]
MASELVYEITGGDPVRGRITALGAKNFVTKAMVAALLGDSPTTLTNVPPIGDVDITAQMLRAVGVLVESAGERQMRIDAQGLAAGDVPLPHSGSNRIPILLLGALLHRFDQVAVPLVGGCMIGKRGVDFHLGALEAFGARVESSEAGYLAQRNGALRGADIRLPYPSVGATETCLYLGSLARGRSVIRNAASEPEIMELITMLRGMGAIIFTRPGREIVIEGVEHLRGTKMQVLGDRIEAASWACLAAASEGEIIVEGARPDSLGNFLSYFAKAGGGFELEGPQTMRFFRRDRLSPCVLETDVFPGFSTDWQQPFAVVLTQADGVSVLHETVYEHRLGYLSVLDQLGAMTQVYDTCLGGGPCRFNSSAWPHSAIIQGPSHLRAVGTITVPDLRAGLAYIIAAVVAKGSTELRGADFVERGYGNVVPRLQAMGVAIERVVRG